MKEIEVASFVPLSKVDPILFQKSYYLEPEELGMKAFALLRRVLEEKQMVAIATFTLRTKEHACVLRAYEDALALSPLFYQDEVKATDGLRKPDGVEVPPQLLDLAKQYVEALSGSFDHARYSDGYRAALLNLLNEKAEALAPVEERVPKSPALPDLIEALRHAVEDGHAGRKAPARPRVKAPA
jgi:DNA end-binding protein Ku